MESGAACDLLDRDLRNLRWQISVCIHACDTLAQPFCDTLDLNWELIKRFRLLMFGNRVTQLGIKRIIALVYILEDISFLLFTRILGRQDQLSGFWHRYDRRCNRAGSGPRRSRGTV